MLSERALVEFCAYFLETAIDQVGFMAKLIEPGALLRRIEVWCARQVAAKKLERGSYQVLREVWYQGSIERGQVPAIATVRERQGREIVSRLLELRVLKSELPRGPLRLNFPIDVVEEWFPGMYPPFSRMPETGTQIWPSMGMM
jgi:hypothetical protein